MLTTQVFGLWQSGLLGPQGRPGWTAGPADGNDAGIGVEYNYQAAFRRQMCHRSWFGVVARLLLLRWRRVLHTDIMLRDSDATDAEAIKQFLFDFALTDREQWALQLNW